MDGALLLVNILKLLAQGIGPFAYCRFRDGNTTHFENEMICLSTVIWFEIILANLNSFIDLFGT